MFIPSPFQQFFLEGMRMGDLGHIIGFQANNQTYKRAKELLDKWTLEKQLVSVERFWA